jgi:hypothetical protein
LALWALCKMSKNRHVTPFYFGKIFEKEIQGVANVSDTFAAADFTPVGMRAR